MMTYSSTTSMTSSPLPSPLFLSSYPFLHSSPFPSNAPSDSAPPQLHPTTTITGGMPRLASLATLSTASRSAGATLLSNGSETLTEIEEIARHIGDIGNDTNGTLTETVTETVRGKGIVTGRPLTIPISLILRPPSAHTTLHHPDIQ